MHGMVTILAHSDDKSRFPRVSGGWSESKAGPTQLEINGQPILQHEIHGATEGVKIIFLHTTVDTGQYLHQILAWTMPSYFEKNRTVLESVVNSFQATSPE